MLRQIAGRAIVAVCATSLGMSILVLAVPIYSLQVFDRVLISRSTATLAYLTLIVIVLISAHAFLEAMRLKLLLRIGNRIQLALESKVLEACVAASARISAPVTHPLRDLAIVRNFLAGAQGIVALIDTPLAVLFLIAVFLIHPWLGVAMIVGIAALVLVALMAEGVSHGPVKAAHEAGVRAQGQMNEIIHNAETVEAMGMRTAVFARWQQLSHEALHFQSIGADHSAVLTALGRWIRLVLGIGLTGLGAYLAIEDRITMGGMIASGILVSRGLAPLENFIPLWRQWIGARTAFQRLTEALAQFPRNEVGMNPRAPTGVLSIEQISYVPPKSDVPILKGISLGLPAGAQLGLVGPVSAGKSTLVKLICGIWKPRTGTVRLDNADVYPWEREDFGRILGYLPQGAEFFSGSVRDNIARFALASDDDVIAAARLAGIHDSILRFPAQYETQIGATGIAVSAGMRQRIGLARAIFGTPKLVVLDEPSANLDAEGKKALMIVLNDLKARHITTIVITHELAFLQNVDFIGVMVDGQLKDFGTRGEVTRRAAAFHAPSEKPLNEAT